MRPKFEGYIGVPLIPLLLIVIIANGLIITKGHSQPNSACSIIAELEPLKTNDFRFPLEMSNQNCLGNSVNWDINGKPYLSDDLFTSVELNPKDKSSCLRVSNFFFDLPYGAKVEAIKVKMEGFKSDSAEIKTTKIQLVNGEAKAVGQNKAGAPSVGTEWTQEKTTWKYGFDNDDWNAGLTFEDVNSSQFGIDIQISNESNSDTLQAFLDQIKIIVYYTPLFTLCDHDCFAFYIEEESESHSYNWIIPEEFEFRSVSNTEKIVNIGIRDADFGHYTICAEVYDDEELIEECCREMLIDNCSTGVVGDYVWEDKNGDGAQSSDELGMPDIKVKLMDIKFNTVSETSTDNQGYYEFAEIPEGYYFINFDQPDGFYFSPNNENVPESENSDVSHNLGFGTTEVFKIEADKHLMNIDAGLVEESSIGNMVWEDINGDGVFDDGEPGIEGVRISLFDEFDGFIGETMTNAEGNYFFTNLTAGNYYLKMDVPDNYELTRLFSGIDNTLDNDFNENGITEIIEIEISQKRIDIDAGLYRYSQIGDFVWFDENRNGLQDIDEMGMEDISVLLLNSNGDTINETITTNEGFYGFSGIIPGTYYLLFDASDELLATHPLFGQIDIDSDISNTNGTNTTDNFKLESGTLDNNLDAGFYSSLGIIKGHVWYDVNYNGINESDEAFISGLEVELYNSANELIQTQWTDEFGGYYFENIILGSYYLKFGPRDNATFTLPDFGDDTQDSDVSETNGIGTTSIIEITIGALIENIDAGFVEFAEIGDRVWLDHNENGIQDIDEPGINNVIVTLYDASGSVLSETISNDDPANSNSGYYLFTGLLPGDYYLSFETDKEFSVSFNGSNGDDDSNVTGSFGTGTTDLISVESGQSEKSIDAGILPERGSISGLCWIDFNEDGIRDNDEELIPGTNVNLFTAGGELLSSQLTGANGSFLFTDLLLGSYYLVFESLELTEFTLAHLGSSLLDNDVTNLFAQGSTDIIEVLDGSGVQNVDAGYIEIKASIGDYVWLDQNANGIQDSGEPGIQDVKIYLFSGAGELLDSTITANNGNYQFNRLDPGNYYVQFLKGEDFSFSPAKIGANDNADSDVTQVILDGTTDIFNVAPGEIVDYIDAGVFKLSGLGDYIWWDENEDGIQQTSEDGINNLSLELYDDVGNFITSTLSTNHPNTNKPGYYYFGSIIPGAYKVLVELPDDFLFSASFTTNEAQDSDIENIVGDIGATGVINLTSGVQISTVDIGMYQKEFGTSSIGDYVWHDLNNNGIQENNEFGLNDVEVVLLNRFKEEIADTITSFHPIDNTEGYYQFDQLVADDYYIVLKLTPGLQVTDTHAGSDPERDSNFSTVLGEYISDKVTLVADQVENSIDAGIRFVPAKVGDYVWADKNENGIQEDDEIGINDVSVELYNSQGELLNTTSTSNNQDGKPGYYLFENLIPGAYYLRFESQESYPFSGNDLGGNDTKDSDVTGSNGPGTTSIFSLGSAETELDVDAGLIVPGTINIKEEIPQQQIENTEINFYPNPLYSDLNLDIRPNTDGPLTLDIYDFNGKKVIHLSRDLKSGKEQNFKINLDDCPAGLYLIRIVFEDQIITQILAKQDL